MLIKNLEKFPENLNFSHGEISSIYDDDFKFLENLGIEAAYYWYVCGSYEGSGQMIALKENKWYVHDLGHCSCYGPLEHFTLKNPLNSLDEIKENSSDEYYNRQGILELIELIKKCN